MPREGHSSGGRGEPGYPRLSPEERQQLRSQLRDERQRRREHSDGDSR
jgi:uncharacterized membrane protein